MSDNERGLIAEEINTLLILVDMIIPASGDFALPSASDPQIFADLVNVAQRHRDKVGDALSSLDAVAYEEAGCEFCETGIKKRIAILESFRRTHVKAADLLATLTVQCYYRDSRVMRSLNMESRAPYPIGFEVNQGNWSLLDPVRNRTPNFRKPP
jgi:hypothetical protein